MIPWFLIFGGLAVCLACWVFVLWSAPRTRRDFRWVVFAGSVVSYVACVAAVLVS